MTDRRGFLKLFGAGAMVAPVVAGMATNTGAMARLIEEPKVEIIPPPELVVADHISDMQGDDIVVFCRHVVGRLFVLEAKDASITSARNPINGTDPWSPVGVS